ncbi:peptidase S8/S53 domain-containing protein [Mycena latifolia]|nr:peptidase S8/S53 domain-containing protein [Mycena latifolia]
MAPLEILQYKGTVNPQHYIVTLCSDVSITGFISRHNLTVVHIFDGADGAVYGFGAKLSDAQLQAVRNDPGVEEIEQDGLGTCTAIGSQNADTTWGLARLFTSGPVSLGVPEGQYQITRDLRGGEGVDIYIVDCGVRASHNCFGSPSRAADGYNALASLGVPATDSHGHGTACAGIAAGEKFGVANHANIIPVKVWNPGYEYSMTALDGLYWIRKNAKKTRRPSVVSMSLTFGYCQKLNAAVDGLVRSGVPVVVAAGNHKGRVTTNSPQSATWAIVVGGTDKYDRMYDLSGFGPRVDIFAPAKDLCTYLDTSNSTDQGYEAVGKAR